MIRLWSSLFLLQFLSVLGSVHQTSFGNAAHYFESDWTTFPHPIKRVAVIGAGPAGLQAVATLTEQNFTVRLFERDENPGGNWRYSEQTPIRESYPYVAYLSFECMPEGECSTSAIGPFTSGLTFLIFAPQALLNGTRMVMMELVLMNG